MHGQATEGSTSAPSFDKLKYESVKYDPISEPTRTESGRSMRVEVENFGVGVMLMVCCGTKANKARYSRISKVWVN